METWNVIEAINPGLLTQNLIRLIQTLMKMKIKLKLIWTKALNKMVPKQKLKCCKFCKLNNPLECRFEVSVGSCELMWPTGQLNAPLSKSQKAILGAMECHRNDKSTTTDKELNSFNSHIDEDDDQIEISLPAANFVVAANATICVKYLIVSQNKNFVTNSN